MPSARCWSVLGAVLFVASCVEGGDWHLIEITTSVFGDIPNLEDNKDKYGSWLKVTYSQSMLQQDAPGSLKSKGLDLVGRDSKGETGIPDKGGKVPRVEGPHIVEPFAESDWVPGVSPFKRIVMKTVFSADASVDGNMEKYYENLCVKDHKSSGKVLESALLRAAELSDLYPTEGVELATTLTKGLPPSVNYLSVLYFIKVEFRNVETGEVDDRWTCGTDIQDGSDQAIPFLPRCPRHSQACARHPEWKACRDQPLWLCKCDLGYEGDLRLNDMVYDDAGNIVKDELGRPRFEGKLNIMYVGECKIKKNYCDVEKPWRSQSEEEEGNYGKNMFMVSPEGDRVNATGVLGERGAMPQCPDKMRSSGGTATCTLGDDDESPGKWEPFIGCWVVVPERPPTEPCPRLNTVIYTDIDACSGCKPKLEYYPEEPFVDCPNCTATCNAESNYRDRQKIERKPTCKAIEEACPDASVWEDDVCREAAGGKEVNRYCCEEAWEYGVKPLKKKDDRKCSDIKDMVGCLRARDSSSNKLCCFNTDEANPHCFEKGSNNDESASSSVQCGVGPEIYKGVWEGLPDCAQMCVNNLHTDQVDAPGCKGLVPGETCLVECKGGFENIGPKHLAGPESPRECRETLDFGPPPVCASKPVQYCADPATDSLDTDGCSHCLAEPADSATDASTTSCQCKVTCKDGYGLRKQATENTPSCVLVDRQNINRVESCSGLDREACASSYEGQEKEDSTEMERLPCCWTSADETSEGEAKGECVSMHSEAIKSTKAECATLKEGVFENLPTCLPKCTNDFLGNEDYDQDLARRCSDCIPGESCEGCEVSCNKASGLERFGGHQEGDRHCSEKGSFEEGPLCGKPPEQRACEPPHGEFITVTHCEGCFNGSNTCRCDVQCKWKDRYKVVEGEEGDRVCEAHFEDLINTAECQEHGKMEDCLNSRDKISNQPCCWNEDGFNDGDSAAKCLAKGHQDMARLPSYMTGSDELACAATPVRWSKETPQCDAYAVRPWAGLSHVKDQDCDRCLLSNKADCKCQVWCESSEQDLWVAFYGGGPEARGSAAKPYRQPQEEHRDQDDRPTLGPAPVCLPVPVCVLPPDLPQQLVTTECEGVQAEGNCTVTCADSNSFAFKKDGKRQNELVWQCSSDKHLKERKCEGLSKEECLVSVEEGEPCGFQQGHCHQKGSAKFEALSSSSTEGVLDTPLFAHRQWDEPQPQCKQLCKNIFETMSIIESTEGCNNCFPDSCDCHVECKKPFIWIPGGPSEGNKNCTDGDFKFNLDDVPLCRAEGDQCGVPANVMERLTISAGCKDCKAGEKCPGCTADCSLEADPSLTLVHGAKGEQMCCPSVVVRVKNKCKNPKNKDQIVADACCDKAKKKGGLDPSQGCTAIQDRGQCLGSEDKHMRGTACCWLNEACVPASSDEIDNDHLPSACADMEEKRGAVTWWPTWPTCAKKCTHDFDGKEELTIEGDGCKESTDWALEKNKTCDVQCASGFDHYGGGPVGDRTCNRGTATFGPVPLCAKPKCGPPVVAVQEAYTGLDSCNGLEVGHRCKVSCAEGFGFPGRSGEISQETQCVESKSRKSEVRSCQAHSYNKDGCLSSQSLGDNKPCCWFGASQDCLEKGSRSITELPTACADDPTFGDDFPVCKPKCLIGDLRGKQSEWGFEFVDEKKCKECVADDEDCDCRLRCKTGFTRIGGGSEQEARHCSSKSLEIDDPPMCMETAIVKKMLNNSYCKDYPGDNVACPRDGKDMTKCHATCKGGFLPVKGQADDEKRCVPVPRSLDPVGCQRVNQLYYWRTSQRKAECLNSREDGDQQAVCCWNSEVNECSAFGEKKLRHKFDQCAQRTEMKWEDELHNTRLECQQQCDSSLIKPDPSIVYEREDCESCVVAGKKCKCDVQCNTKDGYEHVGGKAPGARRCKHGSVTLDPPPVCLKPREPVCRVLDVKESNEFERTSSCTPDKCTLQCKEGWKGQPVELQCHIVEAKLDANQCQRIGYEYGCLQAAEHGVPCCSQRVQVQGREVHQCLPQGHENLRSDAKCALTKTGEWKAWRGAPREPDCRRICYNRFKDLVRVNHYRKESVEGCNGLTRGEACNSLQCDSGSYVWDAQRGRKTQTIPPQVCSGSNLFPAFDNMPQCKPVCQPPANDDGTLDVSNCKEECFPRAPGFPQCSCKLRCAPGTRRTSRLIDPVCTENADGTAVFKNLITCKPECTPPGNQDDLLDTSECRIPCVAGDPECECKLQCKNLKGQRGGGRAGVRTCQAFTEVKTRKSVGLWVLAGSHGQHEAPPLCMAELIVQVVDATTKRPIEGAKVLLADPKQQELDQETNTDKQGMARLPTSLVLFRVDVEVPTTQGGKAFFKNSREVNRKEQCQNIAECAITLAMTPRVDEAGIIEEESCFLVLEKGKQQWQLQATLEWNDKVVDVDIWARQWECADGVVALLQTEMNCYPQFETSNDCRYALSHFLTPGHQYVTEQQQACHTEIAELLDTQPGYGSGFETRMDAKTNRPKIKKKSDNGYSKWVFHDARYAGNLDKKWVVDKTGVNRRIVATSAEAENWNENHWMVLNVDERGTKGPETITFQNVPPGTYQIWANVFKAPGVLSDKVGGRDKNGKWLYTYKMNVTKTSMWGYPYLEEQTFQVDQEQKAEAKVTLTFGHSGVKVICEVPPDCKKGPIGDGSFGANRLWHVADVIIGEQVTEHKDNKNFKKYSIRIEDREEELKKRPVFTLTQPANPNADSNNPPHRKEHGYKYFGYWQPFVTSHYAHACRGKCRLDSGSDKFAACLAKNHKK